MKSKVLAVWLVLFSLHSVAQGETMLLDFAKDNNEVGVNVIKNLDTTYFLETTNLESTGISVSATGFNSTNTSGTSNPMVSGVTAGMARDSFYGNDVLFQGNTAPLGVVELTGLGVDHVYDFVIFASRMSVGDNRQTAYEITGDDTQTYYLNVHNNESQFVRATGILADPTGKVSIRVQKGPQNSNSRGFFYLGAVVLERSPRKDLLWQDLMDLSEWGYAPFAPYAFSDHARTAPVTPGASVRSFEAFGSALPDTPHLEHISGDFDPARLWYGSLGPAPRYVDRGDWDRYLQIFNGSAAEYQTNPGRITDVDGAVDIVLCFRRWNGRVREGFVTGSFTIKVFEEAPSSNFPAGRGIAFFGPSGEKFYSPFTERPRLAQDSIVRVKIGDDRSLKVFVDEVLAIDAFLINPFELKELKLGTNAHPLAMHFRALLATRGEFNAAEIATIYSHTQELWPRNQFPQFPYIQDADRFRSTSFDRIANVWTAAKFATGFSGGNGMEGTHTVQWYYKNSSVPGPSFILDNHRPIDGATGWSLDRDDYDDNPGDPFYGVAGNGDTEIFYVITPYDSDGNPGDPMVSASAKDNIQ